MLGKALLPLCLSSSLLVWTPLAYANEPYDLKIPELSVAEAVKSLSYKTRHSVLFRTDALGSARTRPIDGNYSIEEALEKLLYGTNLKGGLTESGVIVISLKIDADEVSSFEGITTVSTSKVKKTLLAGAAAVSIAGVLPTQVEAQVVAPETTPTSQDKSSLQTNREKEDVIVVTGSRIKRDTIESTVPLSQLSFEQFDELGTTDLAEALTEIPGVAEGVSPRGSNNNIQTSGLSTISLRRLGDDRTLTLINGKRAVSNSGNGDRVSLSTIPSGLIGKTDIVTGGLSAIYGSDAVAGVVNISLEDDFEGFEIDTRYSVPEASQGEEVRLNAKYGTNFNNDRGYFIAGGTYRNFEGIKADSSRPESVLAVEFDDPDTSSDDSFADEINQPGCDPDNEDRHCLLGSLSFSTPGGFFENGDAWFADGRWFNDRDLTPGDRPPGTDAFSDADGFNFRPGRSLLAEREIINIGSHLKYDFSNSVEGSFTALYSNVQSAVATGFETLNHGDNFGLLDSEEVGNIASDHPFIPPEVEATRSGSVDFDRRVVEIGEQGRINDRDTIRLIGDLSGDLTGKLDWELYGTYGHFSQEQRNPGELNFANARFALDIESDGNGGFQCVDVGARENGCVPLNIFGEGTISTQAADYIRYDGIATQTRDQYTAGGYITGEIFEAGGHSFKGVLGAEFRREEQDTTGDPDGSVGGLDGDPTTEDRFQTSLTTFPSLSASYDVVEAFAEIEAPLSDNFTVEGAGRIAEYSTVGTITSWNLGARWNPMDSINFRANLSRAQRAPNLTEFFSLPRPDADDLNDPCEGLEADGSGISGIEGNGSENADIAIVTRNCLSEVGIQNFFLDPENAGEEFDPGSSVNGPNAGNPNLKEETANTFTVGAIIQPSFISDLTVLVDYFNIQIDDAITAISTQDVVSQCYASSSFPNNRFCDVISRSSTSGEVTEVINFEENLNEENVEGLDVAVKYGFETPFEVGKWDLDLAYTHYFKDEIVFEGIGGVEIKSSSLGEIELAEDEFRASLAYEIDSFRIRYTMIYEQGGVDDIAGDPNATDDRFFELGDETFHRVYARYDFGGGDQYRVYGGVNNIFDNFGPVYPTGTDGGSNLNITSNLNDIKGREFYVGARVRF